MKCCPKGEFYVTYILRGKSLLESWVTTFLPNWQLPLIFVRFISNFLSTRSNSMARGKSLLESWITTFLSDLQPPLIFVRFTSKSHKHYPPHYQSSCKYKKFEINRTKIKGSCQLGRKVVTHDSKSDLPLI